MSEIAEVAGLFAGVGIMACLFVVAYLFYQFARATKSSVDREESYDWFEILSLESLAKGKQIDMQKEALKRGITHKKSFRRRLEEEMAEQMFPSKDKEK